MKKGLTILAIAALAGVMAFFLMRSHKLAAARGPILDSMPELAWVRTSLKLTDEQFAKVSELHSAYRPQCAEMCGRIAEAHETMEKLIHESPEMTPDLAKAIHQHAVIHAECQEAMLRHIFQTAGVMDQDQSARYIKEMLPFVLDFSHSEPTK